MASGSGEVFHIVLFKWKEGADPAAIDHAIRGLQELKGQIPGILELSCGKNFSDRSHGYHCGLLVRFTDRAALDVYGPHPAHQEVVQTRITPIREDVIALDYEA